MCAELSLSDQMLKWSSFLKIESDKIEFFSARQVLKILNLTIIRLSCWNNDQFNNDYDILLLLP